MSRNDDDYSSLSPSEKGYISAKSLREFGTSISLTSVLMLVAAWLGIIYYDYVNKHFHHSVLFDLSLGALIAFTGMVLVDLYRGFRAHQQFNDWRRDFVSQQYILYFEGTIPKGNTTVEKVLSLARLVFPELRKNRSSSIIHTWRSWLKIGKTKPDEKIPPKALNYKIYSETIDLVLKSKEGYFIVKDFKDKIVTFKDLKQFVNLVLLKFPNDIFRIVCVSTQYDTPFFQWEWLEQKMTRELMTKRERFLDFSLFRPTLWKGLSVDLLVEYKEGYSVLWIG